MKKWLGILSVLVLVIIAVTVGFSVGNRPAPQPTPIIATATPLSTNPDVDPGTSLGGRPAPNFKLTNQFGQRMSLAQFRGKVVVLAFTDSQCTTICPITTETLVEAVRMLGSAGSSVQLLGVDANPNATSVADVKAYSVDHGLLTSWDFLTGSPAQLAAVWKQYGIYVAVVHGAIDHTPAVYLINQRGQEEDIYDSQMAYASIGQQAHVLASAIARLLPHSPPLPNMSYQYIPGISPTSDITMPTTSHQSVNLGPGHAHLLVFFATWVRQTSDLAKNLEALNQYQVAARQNGWPSAVAIDDAPTEPSSDALRNYLAGLPTPLKYPIAIDTTGQVADGYNVQDQPWLELTAPSGKIVWTHDGWLSLTMLEAKVGQLVKAGRI